MPWTMRQRANSTIFRACGAHWDTLDWAAVAGEGTGMGWLALDWFMELGAVAWIGLSPHRADFPFHPESQPCPFTRKAMSGARRANAPGHVVVSTAFAIHRLRTPEAINCLPRAPSLH